MKKSELIGHLTETDVQRGLFWNFRGSSEMMIPNYTPDRWWECDLFRVMKSGYIVEYEIKLSVADFNKDKLKCHTPYYNWRLKEAIPGTNYKHNLLSEGKGQKEGGFCPNRFVFVVDRAIVDRIEVPEWAGLLTVYNGNVPGSKTRPYCLFSEERKARLLHKDKTSVKDWRVKLAPTFYHRYWNLKTK